MPGDIVRLMLIRKGRFIYLDYELTSLDFDSYIKYYDKRRNDLEEEQGKEEGEPESEPKKEEEEEPSTPNPTPKPPQIEDSD